jgi:hypothetical protein
MAIKQQGSDEEKEPITEIGHMVPDNFKFALIVAIVVFWAEFLRLVMVWVLSLLDINSPILSNFVFAVIATFLGLSILAGYPKIVARLRKFKI